MPWIKLGAYALRAYAHKVGGLCPDECLIIHTTLRAYAHKVGGLMPWSVPHAWCIRRIVVVVLYWVDVVVLLSKLINEFDRCIIVEVVNEIVDVLLLNEYWDVLLKMLCEMKLFMYVANCVKSWWRIICFYYWMWNLTPSAWKCCLYVGNLQVVRISYLSELTLSCVVLGSLWYVTGWGFFCVDFFPSVMYSFMKSYVEPPFCGVYFMTLMLGP